MQAPTADGGAAVPSLRRGLQDFALLMAEALTGLAIGEGEYVAADADIVVLIKDAVSASANDFRRSRGPELVDEPRQQVRQPPLMRGGVGLDVLNVVVEQGR